MLVVVDTPGFNPAVFLRRLDSCSLWRCFHAPVILAAQPSTAQWTPWDHAQALVLANGNQFPFGGAVQQIVKRLQAAMYLPPILAAQVNSFLQLPTGIIA